MIIINQLFCKSWCIRESRSRCISRCNEEVNHKYISEKDTKESAIVIPPQRTDFYDFPVRKMERNNLFV